MSGEVVKPLKQTNLFPEREKTMGIKKVKAEKNDSINKKIKGGTSKVAGCNKGRIQYF